jgi:hypothetical protein
VSHILLRCVFVHPNDRWRQSEPHFVKVLFCPPKHLTNYVTFSRCVFVTSFKKTDIVATYQIGRVDDTSLNH